MFPVHRKIKMLFPVFVSQLTEQNLEKCKKKTHYLQSREINLIPNSQGIYYTDHRELLICPVHREYIFVIPVHRKFRMFIPRIVKLFILSS
jgi:hypothetical protein